MCRLSEVPFREEPPLKNIYNNAATAPSEIELVNRKVVVVMLSLSAALQACAPPDSSETADATTIRSFSVTDTNGNKTAGASTAVFDSSSNGGVFTLEHDAASTTQAYRVDWYISTDSVLSEDDKQFFGRNCNIDFGDCADQSGTFSCQYTSDVKTVCTPTTARQETNLSTYFADHSGLPGSYMLIFQVCNGLLKDCVQRTVPASFL